MGGSAGAMRLDRAIDRYLGDLSRRGYSRRTRDSYFRKLSKLYDRYPVGSDLAVEDVTEDDCRALLDTWNEAAPATRYHSWAVLSGFFQWAYRHGLVEGNPMARIEAPKRLRPEELDVTTISDEDVVRLFNGCRTWREALCLSTLAYLGARRSAVSNLRWRDVDMERATVRLREKGGKAITKPLPNDLLALYRRAVSEGVGGDPDSYVIPLGRQQQRDGDRDDRVVWRIVKDVAERAGVTAHVHSLRHAFAVRFLESNPGRLDALQALLGHARLETTQTYLRRLDTEKAMEAVRDLSWGPRLPAFAGEAHTGFEPVLPP